MFTFCVALTLWATYFTLAQVKREMEVTPLSEKQKRTSSNLYVC